MTEQVKNLMSLLECSEEEAKDIIAQDKKIDKGEKVDFDLTKEKQKQAQKYAHTGSRTVYKWTPRKRKENPEKRKIIDHLFTFLSKFSNLQCENVQITNVERQISFKIGENSYELTLVCKRKPKNE